MTNTSGIFIAALALTALDVVAQQQVYKSVDADGKVTYSSAPPDPGTVRAFEQVPIAPPPSEEQRQAAERRLRQIEQESARIEKRRTASRQNKQASVAATRKDLEDARIALEEAKIMTPGDWQTIATGGRVPKQSYLDRVRRAEERVKDAESALRQAPGGR